MLFDVRKFKSEEDFDVAYIKVMQESHRMYFMNNMDESKRLALAGAKLIDEKKKFTRKMKRRSRIKKKVFDYKKAQEEKKKQHDKIDTTSSDGEFNAPTE